MATCRETVEGALRKLGKLGAGRSARLADADDTLEVLKGLYFKWINEGAFGRLRDVVPTTSYTAGENERVFRNTEAVASITLPELVTDQWHGTPAEYGSRWVSPATVNQSQRPPMDCSVVVVSDTLTGTTLHYLYDRQRASWVTIDDLTLDAVAPLSQRDPMGLAACVAVQIADQFGQDVPGVTAAQAAAFQSGLTNRWSMPRRQVASSYF